jgi:hypothetical protein
MRDELHAKVKNGDYTQDAPEKQKNLKSQLEDLEVSSQPQKIKEEEEVENFESPSRSS